MNNRHGFGRTECIAAIVAVVVLLAVIVVGLDASRHRSRVAVCQSNMKQAGIFLANDASDYKEAIAGFTWRAGMLIDGRSGRRAETDLEAVVYQALDLFENRGGFSGVEPDHGWLPNVSYSLGLMIGSYTASMYPDVLHWCPADTQRHWRVVKRPEAELGRYKSDYFLLPPDPLPETKSPRWKLASSYQFVPAAYSPDEATGAARTIAQGDTDSEYLVPAHKPFGDRMRRHDEVAFPGAKVSMFDSHDRHFARTPLFYAHPQAKQPLLFFDTSVRTIRTADTNPGFRPNNPTSPLDTVFTYHPHGDAAKWNPPPLAAGGDVNLQGRYRWTRGGLRGRDVGPTAPPATGAAAEATAAEFVRLEP